MMEFNSLTQAWQQFWSELFAHPEQLTTLQTRYWQEVTKFWENMPNTIDKRFHGEAWEKDQYFRLLKESYLFNVRFFQNTVDQIKTIDKKSANKIRFAVEQWLNALSPANFPLTNPEVLKETIATNGENLRKGMENFFHDLQKSRDIFKISMTDTKAFNVGENLAITKGKVIYQNDLMQLIQYSPTTERAFERPLLFIPPWINKYYILDLQPQNSLTKFMVDQGFSVFTISWVNPNSQHAHKEFSHYLIEGALAAIHEIQKVTGSASINVMGFCIGGTLLATTLAYLAAKKQTSIHSATFLATLLDFSDPGDLGVFIDEAQIQTIEKIMAKTGYLDGGYMSATFNLLRSNDLIWHSYINNYLRGLPPAPFDILFWNADATNMPAKMHSQYLREMYLHNRLREPGGMTLAGVPMDLTKITIPTYCLATQQDHIAPWHAAFDSMKLLSSQVRFVLGESGHVAGVINPPINKKYGYYAEGNCQGTPEKWLASTEYHKDSWWNDWVQWLSKHSGKRITAQKPAHAIEDAPGSYVKVRLGNT